MNPQDFGLCAPHQWMADPCENVLKCVGLVDRQTHNRKYNLDKTQQDNILKYAVGLMNGLTWSLEG